MRILVCFILFTWAGLSACETDGESFPPPKPTGIAGNWTWYKTWGFGVNHTPQNTNQQFSLILKSDSSFSRAGSYSGIPTILPDSTGSFQLRLTGDCGSPVPASGIKFFSTSRPNGGLFPKYKINSGDTLILDTGSPCDLPMYYFVRN